MPTNEQHTPAIIEEGRLATFKHWARRVTLASIFGNALFGIWAVAGPLDNVGAAALATSLLLTAAGVTSVACAAAIPERRIGWLVPLIGIISSIVGFALLIGAAWNDFEIDVLWRLGGSLVVVAVSVGYASLLSDVHLTGRYRRLLRTAYVLLVAAVGLPDRLPLGMGPGRGMAVLRDPGGAAGGHHDCGTGRGASPPRQEPSTPDIKHCPYCGGTARSRGDKARCADCHRRFRATEF